MLLCTRILLVLTRVALVLSRIVSCCTPVASCCLVLSRVVTRVVFKTSSFLTTRSSVSMLDSVYLNNTRSYKIAL